MPIPTLDKCRHDDWVADCLVCGTNFAVKFADSPTNPHPYGLLCPDCRARGHVAPGVLTFRRRTPESPQNMLKRWLNGEEITIQSKKFVFPHGKRELKQLLRVS